MGIQKKNQAGFIVVPELILIVTVLVIGLIVGMVAVRAAYAESDWCNNKKKVAEFVRDADAWEIDGRPFQMSQLVVKKIIDADPGSGSGFSLAKLEDKLENSMYVLFDPATISLREDEEVSLILQTRHLKGDEKKKSLCQFITRVTLRK